LKVGDMQLLPFLANECLCSVGFYSVLFMLTTTFHLVLFPLQVCVTI
jgi:hypothetical protein